MNSSSNVIYFNSFRTVSKRTRARLYPVNRRLHYTINWYKVICRRCRADVRTPARQLAPLSETGRYESWVRLVFRSRDTPYPFLPLFLCHGSGVVKGKLRSPPTWGSAVQKLLSKSKWGLSIHSERNLNAYLHYEYLRMCIVKDNLELASCPITESFFSGVLTPPTIVRDESSVFTV